MRSSNDSFNFIDEIFKGLMLEHNIDIAVEEGKSFKEINDMYKRKEKTKEMTRGMVTVGTSGSGKTTLLRAIIDTIPKEKTVYIQDLDY